MLIITFRKPIYYRHTHRQTRNHVSLRVTQHAERFGKISHPVLAEVTKHVPRSQSALGVHGPARRSRITAAPLYGCTIVITATIAPVRALSFTRDYGRTVRTQRSCCARGNGETRYGTSCIACRADRGKRAPAWRRGRRPTDRSRRDRTARDGLEIERGEGGGGIIVWKRPGEKSPVNTFQSRTEKPANRYGQSGTNVRRSRANGGNVMFLRSGYFCLLPLLLSHVWGHRIFSTRGSPEFYLFMLNPRAPRISGIRVRVIEFMVFSSPMYNHLRPNVSYIKQA